MADLMWDIQTDEPAKWFSRFEAYRMIGPQRTIHQAYEAEKVRLMQTQGGLDGLDSPGTWVKYSKQYQWKQRAAASDNEQVIIKRIDAKSDREIHRKKRRKLLDIAYSKALKFIKSDDFTLNANTKTADVIRLVSMLTEQSRLEYDDLPAQQLKLKFSGMQTGDLMDYVASILQGGLLTDGDDSQADDTAE